MKMLTTTIKRHWLEQIVAGKKTVEYREIKPYWTERLKKVGEPPFLLRLINGMAHNAPEATVQIDRVRKDTRSGAYELHIGRIFDMTNWGVRSVEPEKVAAAARGKRQELAFRNRRHPPRKRAWTVHWQGRNWTERVNREGVPVQGAGSNMFRKRGVSEGDSIYVVSLIAGELYLGGRMVVEKIDSREAATRAMKSPDLYDAEQWALGRAGGGSPLNLRRKLDPELVKQLRFESPKGPTQYKFISDTKLDNQTTRGIRELTPDSAAILERVIEVTDARGARRGVATVRARDIDLSA